MALPFHFMQVTFFQLRRRNNYPMRGMKKGHLSMKLHMMFLITVLFCELTQLWFVHFTRFLLLQKLIHLIMFITMATPGEHCWFFASEYFVMERQHF